MGSLHDRSPSTRRVGIGSDDVNDAATGPISEGFHLLAIPWIRDGIRGYLDYAAQTN